MTLSFSTCGKSTASGSEDEVTNKLSIGIDHRSEDDRRADSVCARSRGG